MCMQNKDTLHKFLNMKFVKWDTINYYLLLPPLSERDLFMIIIWLENIYVKSEQIKQHI